MLERIREFIAREQLLRPGDRIILGVSGGPDSMALLYIMKELAPAENITLAAAHLNHGLRIEAAGEEEFLRDYCRQAGIPLYVEQADIGKIAREQKKNVEETGRERRYMFFRRLQQELRADSIATAHHYDDQVETVLMHLVRGSGIRGLRGISPRAGGIIRPLLAVKKNEIMGFVRQNNIPWRLDPSNEDPSFLRNRIRLRLLPLLEREYNPAIGAALFNLAEIARGENEVMEEITRKAWDDILHRQEAGEIILDGEGLRALSTGVQRRLLLLALSRLAGEKAWELRDIELLRALSERPGSAKTVHLKKNVKVIKSYDKLIFTYKLPSGKGFSYPLQQFPCRVILEESGEEFSFDLVGREILEQGERDLLLDYDKMRGPLYLRSRRPGDRIRPPGMKGSKKIQDLLTDKKIPYYERDQIALLAGEEIYAIPGIAVSRMVLPDQASTRLLRIVKRPWPSPDTGGKGKRGLNQAIPAGEIKGEEHIG